ncbi:DUF4247 domain-containing protein [Streptomyces marincola]|uniref:DUF4247 domain-containing protein n=1 Tax=Streptomyces marincola TaxID=2878388 RepID=UPI001CF52B37|nr:DUF4247 domain-containing protein [Streptomyces marincola]UCM87790.1 DUF4247 domain-containing protein [Streptomyces marincola]
MIRPRTLSAAAVTGALLITGCGGGGDDDDDAPRAWIAATYESTGIPDRYRDARDTPVAVAHEIIGERRAEDRVDSGGMVFLRYDDDVVVVAPRGAGGSDIEIDGYDEARSHYSSHVGHVWPASPSRGGGDFRGGGPGSGK